MADLQKLVDELSTLTVMEAAELSKKLEETWGVSAAAPVVMAGGAAAGAAAEEKSEFDVVLASLALVVSKTSDVKTFPLKLIPNGFE